MDACEDPRIFASKIDQSEDPRIYFPVEQIVYRYVARIPGSSEDPRILARKFDLCEDPRIP